MNYQCRLNICSVISYEECMVHRSCLNRQSDHLKAARIWAVISLGIVYYYCIERNYRITTNHIMSALSIQITK